MTKKQQHIERDPFLEREAQKYENPIPSREFILARLTALKVPVKRRALASLFELTTDDQLEAFRRRLKAMVRDGQLLKTPEGFSPILEKELCLGRLVIEREGEGHLRTKDGQYVYLSGSTLKGYYDGDEVEVQIIQYERRGYNKGRIVRLLKAVVPYVIGRLISNDAAFELLPFDRKFSQNLSISRKNKGKAQAGNIVQVEVLREENPSLLSPQARVVEVLGDFSTPGVEVKMALLKFNVPHEWPKAVIEEAEKFGEKVNLKRLQDRIDLRELPLVTIDGEDAKDFDDAVYCEPTKTGGWRLWVAIADVSFYVKPGSSLDKEAMLRGNSTYFPGSAVPMLPESLSNGLCSLKPAVPRLCVVCQMSISSKGVITRSQFYRAVMYSKARLTYTEVAEMLRGNEALQRQYAALYPSLIALHELYHALYQQRKHRGAIDFDTVETRILFDTHGKIKNIVPQVRNVAHKMIEESMLAANVCAAKFIQKYKHGVLYRVHESPPKDKLASLRQFLAELGLDLSGKNQPQPKDFSHLVEKIAHRDDKHMIETVMLRSLSQAQYHPKNKGHFGLAYPVYLHFTSPIRRYPDLITHRVIIDILTDKKNRYSEQELEKLGLACSETERRSDEAARDAQLALKCHYMQNKVGECYAGVITGVASFGIFVELKDIYVEGLIHVTGLGNEYFHYDPIHHRMLGERSKITYRLGDAVEIRVVRVDIETKRIDLELLNSSKPASTKESQYKKPRSKKPRTKKRSRK